MRLIMMVAAVAFAGAAHAAQMVYPAKGQSAEQQKKDEGECYVWAVDRSGYDPANPPAAAPPPESQGPSGALLRGAAKGAIIGEVADGDTGDAALAGAAMGGLGHRRGKHKEAQQAQQSAAAKQQQGQTDFNNARAACLEGRGYSVK